MIPSISLKHKKILLPWRSDIAAVIPDHKIVERNGAEYLALDHGAAETKLLRNFGLTVPAPILIHYDWAGTQPFESQKHTAALLSTEPRAFCLSSMGVGKTRATLYAFDFLRKQGVAARMLVIAPLSTLVDVWEREVFESFHGLSVGILHGTKAQRLKALQVPADIYVINHDGIGVILPELIAKKFDVVTIDELSAFRNHGTLRWKNANALINGRTHHPIVWGLTGSPTPNAPTDAYGQVKLLKPEQVPRSFKRFQQETMTQISQFKWLPKGNANEVVLQAMSPYIRYTLDQCHDIPETIFSTRFVEPSDTQKKLYKKVVDHFYAEYKGREITAVNEGAKLSKLLQISAGFAYTDGAGAYIDAADRIKLVLNLIEEANKKVLIFASYKWIIKALATVIGKYYSVRVITGDTSKSERDETFALFRNSTDPHVIVAHAGTMAHGLTLVEADTIIWYGPTMSAELYEQANARIRRPGQTSHTNVIHVYSTQVEKRAFARLRSKQKMQGLLLSLFEEGTNGLGV